LQAEELVSSELLRKIAPSICGCGSGSLKGCEEEGAREFVTLTCLSLGVLVLGVVDLKEGLGLCSFK